MTEELSPVQSSLSSMTDSFEAGTAVGECVQDGLDKRSVRARSCILAGALRKASTKSVSYTHLAGSRRVPTGHGHDVE